MAVSDAAISTLDKFVRRAQQLYSLPAVAMQVLDLTSHPRVDVAALKDCIENDPALTAKLLRVTNSSVFGLSRKVTDLSQSLALLGTKPLKLLVLGFSLPKNLFTGIEAKVLSGYWQFSLTKSIVARDLGNQFWPGRADDAFIAALLQDIGVLALVQVAGQPFTKLYEKAFDQGWNLNELEFATVGFQHKALSARMLASWGLPDSMVRVVGASHELDQLQQLADDEQEIACAVYLAELFAQLLSQKRPAALAQLLEDGNRLCGLTLPQIETLNSDLTAKTQELSSVLSLELPACDYAELLIQAQNQMAVVVEDMWASRPGEPSQETLVLESANAIQQVLQQAFQRQDGELSRQPPPAVRSSTSGDTVSLADRDSSGSRDQLVADPGLAGRVESAVNACRNARCSLSLVLVEIDDFEQHVVHCSLEGARRKAAELAVKVADVLEADCSYDPVGDSRIAMILLDFDRQQAVRMAKQLVTEVASPASRAAADNSWDITISAGVATLNAAPRNFLVRELIEATERCLYAAKVAGGNSVKSIDVL